MGAVVGMGAELSTMDHVVAVAYFEVDYSEIARIQCPATFLETLLP